LGFIPEIAKHHDLWVIVAEQKSRKDIERFQPAHPKSIKIVAFYFIHKQRNRWLRKILCPFPIINITAAGTRTHSS
jgi:hypothetical protein